jgi:hypothetical protein
MLNLYIAPKSGRAIRPSDAAIDALTKLLTEEAIIGAEADGAHPPGRSVSALFHPDAFDTHLPAELTFEALTVHVETKPRFLPPHPGAGFPEARCTLCGDTLDVDALEAALERLKYFPIDRFELRCPSCRSDLRIADIDFGQPTVVARFWLFIEGAATSRLNPSLMDEMSRTLGVPLVVVPEVPEEDVDDWVPARKRPKRWR